VVFATPDGGQEEYATSARGQEFGFHVHVVMRITELPSTEFK